MFVELWTQEHALAVLPSFAVMLALAFVLGKALANKELKIRMIPLQVIACILLVLEAGKQVVSFSRGYDLYHIPLHFCSLFIFVLPAMAFWKGKRAETVRGVTAALCCAVMLFMLIYPNLIYSPSDVASFFSDFMSFHTVTFHGLVMFAFVLIVALRLHTPQPKGEKRAIVIFMLCYCTIAAIMAQVLKTNFNNFYRCNIPPLESLRVAVENALGYTVSQVMYVLIVIVLDVLFVLLSYWIYRAVYHIVHKTGRHTSCKQSVHS